MRLDCGPMLGVGARGLDGVQDLLDHNAAAVAAGNGAHMALVLVQKLAMAGRTNRMPDNALCTTNQENVQQL